MKGEICFSINYYNPYYFIEFIRKNEKSFLLKELLSNVLQLNISEIREDKVIGFQKKEEYPFELINLKALLRSGKWIDIYLKVIRRFQIKETIYYYWCLLYEMESRKKERNFNSSNFCTVDRVYISEMSKERFKNSIFLSMKNNKEGILKYGAEAHFIDFVKYIENNQDNSNHLERWMNFLNNYNQDILFIGVKANQDIYRSNIKIV